MPGSQVQVTKHADEERYEVNVDGMVAILQYKRDGNSITFFHTEVPGDLEGRGIGGVLTKTALDDARAGLLTVIPRCAFVSAYIKRHPEYLPIVEESYRARLEPPPVVKRSRKRKA